MGWFNYTDMLLWLPPWRFLVMDFFVEDIVNFSQYLPFYLYTFLKEYYGICVLVAGLVLLLIIFLCLKSISVVFWFSREIHSDANDFCCCFCDIYCVTELIFYHHPNATLYYLCSAHYAQYLV